jgi:hypothetical protein
MIDLLGWYGMVLTLLSVVAANYFRGLYNPLIIAGGIALAINAEQLGATHFVVLNIVFVILGVTGLVTDYIKWSKKNDKN